MQENPFGHYLGVERCSGRVEETRRRIGLTGFLEFRRSLAIGQRLPPIVYLTRPAGYERDTVIILAFEALLFPLRTLAR